MEYHRGSWTWRGRLLVAGTIAMAFSCTSTGSPGDSGADAMEFCTAGIGGVVDALSLVCYPACSTSDDCSSLGDLGDGCRTGYACAIVFVKGRFARRPLCFCKDGIADPSVIPIVCRDGGS